MDGYIINIPEGTKDRIFEESRARRSIEAAIVGVFTGAGYSEVMTPEVEFYDTFLQSGNLLPQEAMLKVIDRSGKILVMRPDNTTPIARVAATRLRGNGGVQRLFYNQTVFRSAAAHSGGEGEIPQCGVELIGVSGMEGDAEVIQIAVRAMDACGVSDYHIELGHAGFFKALAAELDIGGEMLEKMRGLVENKNFAALSDLLLPYGDAPAAEAMRRLSRLFGGEEVLDEAEKLTRSQDAHRAISYLRGLYGKLREMGCGGRVRFDLGIVHHIDYYTGVVFRGYVQGAAADVISGGRYDNLLRSFGADAPATGFAINTGAVEDGLKIKEQPKNGRLRIAITKGRLLDDSMELFDKMGLDSSPVRSPGRKLVHQIPNYGIDVVMSKAPDVITYVEHGVCDLGIVGKDTILENGGSFYEVLDLGFGKCRFALAVKEGDDFYGTYKKRVIASKYPHVAESFFAAKGMDVSVIKIEGSVELAPLLGLADGIVDIVETGSTLKANGLVPVETVCDISARLIVNTASMKLYRDEIKDFIERCDKAL